MRQSWQYVYVKSYPTGGTVHEVTEGVDYSWGRPNLATMWGAGKRFAMRYLSYPSGKRLTGSELSALHRQGFAVGLNWEQAAGDMLRGFSVGRTHAAEALRQANALGAPSWVPIYFSADTDVRSGAQMNAVAAYLDGCAAVLGRHRVGLYGSFRVIESLVPSRALWGWQTYAWSGGKVSSKSHIYQYKNNVRLSGADVDLCRTLQASAGLWSPGGAAPAPPSTPTSTTTGDFLMALTDAQQRDIAFTLLDNGAGGPIHVRDGYILQSLSRVEVALAKAQAPTPAPIAVDTDVVVQALREAVTATMKDPATLALLADAVSAELQQRLQA